MTPRDQRSRLGLRIAGLILLTLFAYGNAWNGPFIFDDLAALSSSTNHVGALSPLSGSDRPDASPLAGRPLVTLSFQLNHYLGAENPVGYHAFNIVLHTLNTLLILSLLLCVVREPEFRSLSLLQQNQMAWWISLIWAVHPLLTETVNYTVQRTELMMSFFLLLSLRLAWIGFRVHQGTSPWLAASVFSCFAGVCCKEVACMIPLLNLLLDRQLTRRSVMDLFLFRPVYYVFLFSSWILLGWLSWHGQMRIGTSGLEAGVSPWEYALTQCSVILHYLKLAVWPHPLCLDYEDWPRGIGASTLLGALILAGFFFLTVRGIIRRNWLGFAGAWFFLILAPTSSFIPIGTEWVAERRMYLPLLAVLGVSLPLAFRILPGKIHELRPKAFKRWPLLGIPLVVILLFLTWHRNRQYQDELTLWSDTVQTRPDNARARFWLAYTLIRKGQIQAAFHELQIAVRIHPDHSYSQFALGELYLMTGNPSLAIEPLKKTISLRPKHLPAHVKLGDAYWAIHQNVDAVKEYEEALRMDPQSEIAQQAFIKAKKALTISPVQTPE